MKHAVTLSLLIIAAIGLGACAGPISGSALPQSAASNSTAQPTLSSPAAITVSPNTLTFISHVPQTLTAYVRFAGTLTASSSNTGVATVSPDSASAQRRPAMKDGTSRSPSPQPVPAIAR